MDIKVGLLETEQKMLGALSRGALLKVRRVPTSRAHTEGRECK